MLQHFIVEGRYLGQAPRSRVMVHGEPQYPRPYAFFCPCCGDVWARCPIDGAPEDWMVWSLACRKHRVGQLGVPGSLMLTWDAAFNKGFPQEVIEWEFERHLEFIEKEMKND